MRKAVGSVHATCCHASLLHFTCCTQLISIICNYEYAQRIKHMLQNVLHQVLYKKITDTAWLVDLQTINCSVWRSSDVKTRKRFPTKNDKEVSASGWGLGLGDCVCQRFEQCKYLMKSINSYSAAQYKLHYMFVRFGFITIDTLYL